MQRFERLPKRRGVRRAADRELERLAAVAQLVGRAELGVGLAELAPGLLAELVDRAGDRRSAVSASPLSSTLRCTSRRRGETTSPSAASTPEARGQTIFSISSSSAIAAACIGPAPPNASSA